MNKLQVLVIVTLATFGSVTYGQPGRCNTLTLDTNTKGPSSFYYSGSKCQTWIIKPRNYSIINMDVSWRENLDSCSRDPPLYIYAGDNIYYPTLGTNVRCGVKFDKNLISNGSILVDFRGRGDKGSYSFTIIWSTSPTTEPVRPPQPACGSGPSPRSTKIVGGFITDDYWYFMVALLLFGNAHCGGTLVSDQWVLTAAHCVEGYSYEYFTVVYGTKDRTNGLTRGVSETIIHEQYVGYQNNNPNDIALLRLDSPVILQGIVGRACMPTSDVPPGSNVTAIGYGRIDDGSVPDLLYEVTVPVVEHSVCASNYASDFINIINDIHLCAGVTGKDSCQGDSGGPLLYYQNGTWEVHGVTSFGIGCGQAGYPGVYARVINYVDWINLNCNNCIYMT